MNKALSFILVFVFIFAFDFAVLAEPASASSSVPGTASSTVSKPLAAPTAGMSSAKASADKSAAKPTPYTYVTDADTESLTQAIENYNKEYPNEPISEITQDTVYRLQKYGFLKTPLKTDGMVLRDGKVFKKVKADSPIASSTPQEGVGKSGESLAGTLDGASMILDEKNPSGSVNGRGNPEVKVMEQNVQIRNKGEYKEIKIAIPKLPPTPQPKTIDGTFAEPRKDLLSESLSKGAFTTKTHSKTKKDTRTDPIPVRKVPTDPKTSSGTSSTP